MDDFSPRLVSVASCDLATASAPRLSPALLFSLQFYVDRVALEPATVSTAPVDALLLGFQLLQYEIVVFDTPLSSTEPLVTTLRHGKSCLFEADAGELRDELQRHEDAPLTLLLLAQEHGRARLRAFAAVPLSLHVGLLDEDHSSRVHRICEWAGRSGSWELRDHRNNIVGSATGAVTLSCLGRALAPHLAQVLGVQVSKSQSRPSSPRSELIEVEKEQEERPTKTADCRIEDDIQAERVVEEPKKVDKLDSSVQCDEDMLEDAAVSKVGVLDGQMATTQAKNSRVEGRMLYYKDSSKQKGTASPRRITRRDAPQNEHAVAAAAKGALLFPRELPPPLFFQKARRSPTS
jgi:hypothetical protein